MKPNRLEIAGLGAAAFLVAFSASGFHLNFSGSAPIGIWKEQPIGETPKRGSLVAVCPPESPLVTRLSELKQLHIGDCLNTGVAPLTKAIGAVSGDLVSIRQGHPVLVNGNALPNTMARPNIPGWPDGEYRVAPNQVWVFSTYHSQSFDSRYFGPVPIANIQVQTVPVLVAGFPENMSIGIPHD